MLTWIRNILHNLLCWLYQPLGENMTLTNPSNRADFVGHGATATYPFTFRVDDTDTLTVIQTDTAGTPTYPAYTVTGIGNDAGGSITLTAGNLTNLYKLAIIRTVPLTQETDIKNQGVFFSSVHESQFDQFVKIDQQQQEQVDRAIKFPVGTPPLVNSELPAPVASRMIGFDPSGTALTTYPGTGTVPALLLDPGVGNGTSLVTYKPPFANSVARTLTGRESDYMCVFDFMTAAQIADVTSRTAAMTDVITAMQAGINAAAAAGKRLYFPAGKYRLLATQGTDWFASSQVDGLTLLENSNLFGDGDATEFALDQNCCAGLTTRTPLGTVVTTGNTKKNICIDSIKFTQVARATFDENIYIIRLQAAIDSEIKNCTFYGWGGDAISCGDLANAGNTLIIFSIARNISIHDCLFDGRSFLNRQAISLIQAENIEIFNNTFQNSCQLSMPGAIDIEPESPDSIINGVYIHDNTFSNINAGVAVVSVALTNPMNTAAKDIEVYNNVFNNDLVAHPNLSAFGVYGPYAASATTLPTRAPKDIRFHNNKVMDHAWGFMVFSCENTSISNNEFTRCAYIGRVGYMNDATHWAIPVNFTMSGNTCRNSKVINADPYTAPIQVGGPMVGGAFVGNKFIDCGVWSDAVTVTSMPLIGFHQNADNMKNVVVSDNSATSIYTYPTAVQPFVSSATMVNPSTIKLSRNTFPAATKESGSYLSLFSHVSVAGSEGMVASPIRPVGLAGPTTLTINSVAKTITQATGDFGGSGFNPGDVIYTTGFAAGGNAGPFYIAAGGVSALTLTLNAATTGLVSQSSSAAGTVYTHTKVGYNNANFYTEATLPYALPIGVTHAAWATFSADSNRRAIVKTVRIPGADDDSIFQEATTPWSYATTWRRRSSAGTWQPWVTI